MNAPVSPATAPSASPAPTQPAARLRAALHTLRWTVATLALALGRSPAMPKRWANGEYPVPADVLAWLETLAALHRANPPPSRAQAMRDEPAP